MTRSIRVHFPIFVRRDSRKNYIVRPLFSNDFIETNPDFKIALDTLKKKVRRDFKNLKTDRQTSVSLSWFLFNPDLNVHKILLEFKLGQRFVSASFFAVDFVLEKRKIFYLPDFHHFFFRYCDCGDENITLQKQMIETIQRFFRRKRKTDDLPFDLEKFKANGTEFITYDGFDIAINRGDFPFEEKVFSFFDFLSDDGDDFDGREEIEKVGSDLNDLFPGFLNRCLFREELVEKIRGFVYGKERVPIVLIGPPGVGKTAILHEAIYGFLQKKEIEGKQNQRLEKVWHIDPLRIISGMRIIGMWQKRFEAVLEFVAKPSPKQLPELSDKLFFSNMVSLFRIGKSSQNTLTLSRLLKPYFERKRLMVVGEATPEEWKIIQGLDGSFADFFRVIRVDPTLDEETLKIIIAKRAKHESERKCRFTFDALSTLLSNRGNFSREYSSPGNVLMFMERLASKYIEKEIGVREIISEIASANQVQSRLFDPDVSLMDEELKKEPRKNLIGQEEAVQRLADVVHLIKAGLNDPEKPLGVFLFIGPTGTGKTQAAKELARYLFPSEKQFLRFDMNVYIDEGSLERLIGSLNHPEGRLTGKVRLNPFSVLLLDEIEKAHPKIHDLLLQVLGEGRLTDSVGKTTDFSKTVIIMTSNVGSIEAQKEVGLIKTPESNSKVYSKVLRETFRPEFLNRIDEIVVFKKLGFPEIKRIAELQINEFLKRDGFLRRFTILNVSEGALEKVAGSGFDAQMGGRALKRQIEKSLTSISAKKLAGVPSTSPVLFEINEMNGKLISRVFPIEEISPNPLPSFQFSEKAIGTNFENLLILAEEVWNEVLRVQEGAEYLSSNEVFHGGGIAPEKFFFWSLKEKCGIVKNQLEEIVWALESTRKFPRRFFFSFDSKLVGSKVGKECERHLFRDFCSRMQFREQLEEGYSKASLLSGQAQGKFLQVLINLEFIGFFLQGFRENSFAPVCLIIRSCLEGFGKSEIEFLWDEFFKRNIEMWGFSIPSKPFEIPGGVGIIVKGIRCFEFFSMEQGLHLFFEKQGSIIPIQVSALKVPSDESHEIFIEKLRSSAKFRDDLGKSIRLYRLSEKGEKAFSVTDLRTGLINKIQMKMEDWKLVWYGGFDPKKRVFLREVRERSGFIL